ncbi:MAG: carboxymuconolactone decarboxylase family protein [Pseudomonadota bacterium]
MKRLPLPDTTRLTPEQQTVHDTVVAGPRGRIGGALAFWLHRPEFADRAQNLGLYLRYDTSLPARLSELAILVTARHWGAEFEWIHAPLAKKAGTTAAAVDAIKLGNKPSFDRDDEQVVYDIAKAILTDRHIADELYAQGVAALGDAGMVDLIGILGYYCMICLTLNTFEIYPEPREPDWSSDVGVA